MCGTLCLQLLKSIAIDFAECYGMVCYGMLWYGNILFDK